MRALKPTCPTARPRRCGGRAPRTVYAAAVGARPGSASFNGSGGSVQFAPGAGKRQAAADGAAVGPAVGGHSGYLAFTRNGGGAATASLSSGTVGFAGAPAGQPAASDTLEKPQSDLQSLQQKLKAFGVAGVAAYGLFNTLYYTGAFLFCWLHVAKVPQGLGVAMAARKFVETLALVWAGSQVTKVPRALGALAFAPLADRGLGWLKHGLKLQSKQQAFWVLVGGCLVLAAALFSVVVLAWA